MLATCNRLCTISLCFVEVLDIGIFRDTLSGQSSKGSSMLDVYVGLGWPEPLMGISMYQVTCILAFYCSRS